MASVTNTVGRRGKIMDSGFTATLQGGPALAAALRRLELTTAGEAARGAVVAMGNVIAGAWADRVPVGTVEGGDQRPGAYRDEMRMPGVVKSGINKGRDPEGLNVLKGASGSVGPRQSPKVSGLPADQQPAVYAARLEFGDATHAAEPSARPAFDVSRQAAADAAENVLRTAVMKLTK